MISMLKAAAQASSYHKVVFQEELNQLDSESIMA